MKTPSSEMTIASPRVIRAIRRPATMVANKTMAARP